MKGIILTLTMAMSVVGWEPVDAPIGNDRAIVAAVIIAEAGGESKRGMCAVYEVIHTRASNKGTSCVIEATRSRVVRNRVIHQFSCLNNTSPEKLVRRCSTHKHYKWVHDELLKFVPLTMFTVQENTQKLNRNRADHYYAHKKIAPPYWTYRKVKRGRIEVKVPIEGKVIGNHKFYKLTR